MMMVPEVASMVSFMKSYPAPFALVVFFLIVSFIIHEINARTITVCVGLADNLDPSQRHGTAWLYDQNGKAVRKHLRFDKPFLLDNPNRHQIRDINEQLELLGYEIDHYEILVGDKVRVFRAGEHRPICTAPRYA